MPLVEHLRELRARLLISLVALVPGTILGWVLFEPISRFLTAPLCDIPVGQPGAAGRCGPLVITGLLNPFSLNVKIALATGVVVSAPVWLYQIWQFVTPGLHRHERRWSLAFLATALPLFLAGAGLCYLVLPKATRLLLGFAPQNVGVLVPYDDYLSLLLRLLLVFGLAFEVPVFVVLLNLAGLLPARRLAAAWRSIVFGAFVFAAVATPTGDPFTMLALALPMLAMIAVAYLVCRVSDRRRAARSGEPDYDALPDDETSPLGERSDRLPS